MFLYSNPSAKIAQERLIAVCTKSPVLAQKVERLHKNSWISRGYCAKPAPRDERSCFPGAVRDQTTKKLNRSAAHYNRSIVPATARPNKYCSKHGIGPGMRGDHHAERDDYSYCCAG
jgi:hypothetical protein